ncbi:hypothetical protein FDA94_01865 [Herbidospora galbida]|uniref:RidA family protein n=2 Tax=Herbidospora galbida TaxID=2575442 RepID=A0A4U3MQ15_9ACTN|nr:hypothetical protein FDA94_01865 [Herbidospora galbida]
MFVEVRNGQVVRIEEYTDPAQGSIPPATRFKDGSGWEEQAGYSRAAREGDLIAVSGTTADGPDAYAQTLEALRRGVAAVEALGGSRDTVFRTRLLLTPDADWEQAARAHAEVLGDVAPANSTYVVNALIGEGFLVEVEIDAKAVGA